MLTPVLLFFICMSADSSADTIKLIEDSVLSGKIIREDNNEIIFTNSYGTYRIKKSNIKNIYITNAPAEDIAILKQMKLPANANQIKKNYDAGQNKKERVARGEKIPEKELLSPFKAEFKSTDKIKSEVTDDLWTGGRLSLGGGLTYNPLYHGYGYSAYFALDQGLDGVVGIRHPAMPGLRFEAGYTYLNKPYHTYYNMNQPALLDPTLPFMKTKSRHKLQGIVSGLGLIWTFPSLNSSWGCVVVAVLPGASYLHFKTSLNSGAHSGFFFNAQSILGYQKSFGLFSLFINARYVFTPKARSFRNSLGLEAGFGYHAW
jgi:hypothetical protein